LVAEGGRVVLVAVEEKAFVGVVVGVLEIVAVVDPDGVSVPVTTISTQNKPAPLSPKPKRVPLDNSNIQLPRYVLGVMGATREREISTFPPEGTALPIVFAIPPMISPDEKTIFVSAGHSQEPPLVRFHVLRKLAPGASWVLSGMVTSLTESIFRQEPNTLERVMVAVQLGSEGVEVLVGI
jgi:hypothetical protein